MSERLLNFWESFRSNLWFVPMTMALAALGLAVLMLNIDRDLADDFTLPNYPWIFRGSAEGARLLLSTIAGSMLNVLALVLSLTLVALTLASSQYGHRLLRFFIRDGGNQVVIGTFMANYLYSLIILRGVRGLEDAGFVPQISISVAILLSVAALFVLIYFINHVASSIQVETLVDRINNNLQDTIRRMYPLLEDYREPPFGTESFRESMRERIENEGVPLDLHREGYVQTLDEDTLVELAATHKLIVKLEVQPGDFVYRDTILAYVVRENGEENGRPLDENLAEEIRDVLVVGRRRNLVQDVGFGIDEIVEIALRALSPGINAPFTAVECINRLGATLSMLAERRMPSDLLGDTKGNLRVITRQVSFSTLMDLAFNPIRVFSGGVPFLNVAMLDALAQVARRSANEEVRGALLRHAGMIRDNAKTHLKEAQDLDQVETAHRNLMLLLHRELPEGPPDPDLPS